jgi:lysophospholipase L1-like esterase
MAGRFVAIGDSFTEGIGDWNPRFPNGCRGWADRVARQLSKQDPAWTYANLAIRSKRLDGILSDQLEQALALEPTLISFYAGGNDLLEFNADVPALMERYEAAVVRMRESGAEVLLFTGFDVHLTPLVAPLRRRNWEFNDAVRLIAERHGCTLVDYWAFDEFNQRAYWSSDRLHMTPLGHRQLARRVLETLGVDHSITDEDDDDARLNGGPRGRLGQVKAVGRAVASEHQWMTTWVLPMFARRVRGITLGDELEPKWPIPIYPARGMKWNARRRARISVKQGEFVNLGDISQTQGPPVKS